MRLELEITHRCNKNCELCDHRIATSDYDYLVPEQYWQILKGVKPGDFDSVLLIGGEPLMHPQFVDLAWRVMGDFQYADHIQVATNGGLLTEVPQDLLVLLEWIVQEYPGWNDAMVTKFGWRDNVTVRPHREFWDPYDDPDLDEETARWVADHCQRQVRVVGTKLYRCCLSEGVERYYQTDPVHAEFSENWRQDWENLPVWKACAHCFRAREALAARGEGA